jgi:hypothetical protein
MPESSLASDLVRIHKVFTRALRVAGEEGTRYLKNPPSPELLHGFTLFVQMLFGGLHAHHESEESVAWPYMRACSVPAPYETLIDQHSRIAMLIDSSQSAFSGGNLAAFHAHITQLRELWLAHFPLEEGAFGPAAWPGPMTQEQQAELTHRVAQHQEELMGANPDVGRLIVPFVLYNLEPEDRAIWAAEMPKQVINELVPGPWLPAWSPMKPFLLQ